MPARKPQSLHTRHSTKAEKDARIANEEAMAPERGLPMAAPARLKGHDVASEAWRRLMRLYNELDAAIVTRLDGDLLVDYCIMMEQVGQLDHMRQVAYDLWLELGANHDKAKKEAAAEISGTPEAESKEEMAQLLAMKVLDAFDAIVKLDARGERKRALLKQYREALYLTPRARAGAAPDKKEAPQPVDPLEQLLDNVTDFVNGAGDGK